MAPGANVQLVKWAVLGGGLAGVTLARLLHERGDEVSVLEKEPETGGLCRSRIEGGFTFDTGGSHVIFSRDEEVLAFMHLVLGENREARDRRTKIFYKGRYVKYPFENGLSDLPKEDLFFCIYEFVKTLIAAEKGEIGPPANFRDWMVGTFGKGIAESYLIPYNEKIWKIPPERMSCHWVEGRVPRPPVEDVIRSAIGIETEGYTHQAVFSYPRSGGIQALVQAIAEPVRRFIATDSPVTSLTRRGDGFVVGAGGKKVEVDRVVSTIPLPALLPCLEDVPDEVTGACRRLRSTALLSVFLGIEGQVPPYSWVYVPSPEIGLFNRVSFPSNYSPAVAPEGHSSILAEITCGREDPVFSSPDRDIVDHVTRGLSKMGILEDPGRVVSSGVARSPYAYVVYDLDYQRNIGIVREYCEGQGIDLVGRFSRFEYLNMDGIIRSAMDFVGGLE
ncbi:MAG: FAD-dependent oxidoreductase [Methanomicrobiales archaeon]|nr:FAD-dependent oxidoreductase [Methanomicrobiales archaeon]